MDFASYLTGHTRHRMSLFRKLILQVEYWAKNSYGWDRKWRDASFEDYMDLEKNNVKVNPPGPTALINRVFNPGCQVHQRSSYPSPPPPRPPSSPVNKSNTNINDL